MSERGRRALSDLQAQVADLLGEASKVRLRDEEVAIEAKKEGKEFMLPSRHL